MKNVVKHGNEELIFPRCQITVTSLEIPEDATFREWETIGDTLRKIDGSRLWWWGDWCNHGERRYGEKYTQALEAGDYTYQGLANAAWVSSRIESSRRREKVSWSAHAEVAALEAKDQDRWLDRAERDRLTHRDIRDLIRAERLERETPALPVGTYRVIYADPPWEYGMPQHTTEAQETVLETHYKTMRLDEILALPVRDLAAPSSVLFLWATSPLIFLAGQVIEAWGFDYKSSFVWDKVKHNVGYYNSVRHEFLLIATRGSCLPDSKTLLDSVVSIERTEHSRKPEEFRSIIDGMYIQPKGRNDRIELFCRGELPMHWDAWGAEAK